MNTLHKFFVGAVALTLGASVALAEELVFENTDCTASSNYGNYTPATLRIPESDELPKGTKLRIKRITFAMRVDNSPTSQSAEYLTINGVQSESRNGLTKAPEDWSLGKRMTYEFTNDAIVTVGEEAQLGTVKGSGGSDNIRIYLFKTTEDKYSDILLTTAKDTYRPVYKIVAEVVERAKYLLRVDGVGYSSLEKAFATVGAEERKALEIVDTERLVYDDGKLIFDGAEVDLDDFAILLEEGESGTFTVSLNPARMVFNGGEFLNPYALKGENEELLVFGTSGSYNDGGMTKEKVFDGNLSTYFDPAIASDDSEGSQWAGIGFENPVMITAIKFAVRSGSTAQRINGCSIQGANESDFSDAENIHLIEVDSFYDGAEMAAELEDVHGPYKYVRIIGEYCGNVAELKFYGLVDSGSDAPTTAPIVKDVGLTDDGRPTFTIVADESLPQVYRVERTMVEGDGDEEAFLPLGIRSGATKKWTATSPTPFTAYRVQGVNANGTSPWTAFTIAPDCPAGKPTFSVAPGEYADAQTLEIAYPDAEAEIYYTTDGSEPVNEETGACHRYVGAIALDERPDAQAVLGKIPTSAKEVKDRQGKAYGYYEPTADQPYINVIRARAFKNGVKSAGEAFGTWLIGTNGSRHEGLRVVSLQTSPDNFFSDLTGIMVPGDIYKTKGPGSHSVGMPNANYFQSGRGWEREVNLELFEPEDRSKGFNQRVGVRVRGNWSRAAAKKSLTVYNRAEYGAKNLKYQLFTDEPNQKKFKRFLLRNGGNDWYEGNIRDAIAQGVFRGYLRTCSQGTEPSVLYINGEYWGIYNIRHGYAKQHFENWCGADGDNLDWIKLESSDSGRKYEVQEGDIVEFLKLRQYFRNHDFTTDEELAKAQEMIDFDDMIDYHLVHIFYGNADWISNNNNVGYWRERKPGAKWRFQLYDVDSIMGLTGGDGRDVDGIDKALGGSDDKIPPIFKKLSQNVKFQKMFVNRFADLLNTALKPEVTQGKLAALATKMRPEAARNVARWENMTSVDAWENHISRINDFYRYRPAIQIEHLKSHFPEATGEMYKLALSKNGEGEIQLNTIESGEGEGKFALPFEGDYFELTPVTLTAKPAKGMSLEKWVVNGEEYSTAPTIELELTANTSVEATFIGTPLPEVPTRWDNTNVVERVTLPPGDYEFANANFVGGIDLEEGDYKFKNDGGSSVNSIASLNGPLANVTFTGKGRMNIVGSGDTTLFSVQDLIVLNGVFAVDFTSTVEEVAAVKVARNFLLDEKGKVAITLDGAKPRGIELSNKKMSADFAGGSFTATLKGTKASAFKFKGSDKVTLSGGTMDVTIEGTGAKVLDGGTIVFKDGYVVNVNGTKEATDATVFEAGKTLTVDGGTFNISVPGAGSQILTTADDPEEKDLTLTINGGEFTLLAGDDCVKSAGNDAAYGEGTKNIARDVVITGGNFYGVSTGNDVIDSNGDIIITGGNILAYTTAIEEDGNGSTGLDVNEGRIIDIQGGNVLAIGGPNSSFHYDGGLAYTANGLTASTYSEKFLGLTGSVNGGATHVWAKLPALDVGTISLFAYTLGIDPAVQPSASAESPSSDYATGFHDLYLDVLKPVDYNGGELLTPHAVKDQSGNIIVLGTEGAWRDGTAGKEKVFDGDTSTFFDPPTEANDLGYAWAGIELEKPAMITGVKITGRSEEALRLYGAAIQGANTDDFSDAENIYTIVDITDEYKGETFAAPLEDVHGPYKFLRIIGEYCGNVAELEFYGLWDSGDMAPSTAPEVTAFGSTDGKATFTIVADKYVPQVYRVERTMVEGDGDEEAFLPLGLEDGEEYTWTDSEATPFTSYRVQGVNANGESAWTTFTVVPKQVIAGDESPTFSVAPGTYAEAQSLEITYSDPTAEIWYTTDGSEPTNVASETCHLYTGAITLAEKADAAGNLAKIPTSAKEVKDRQGKAYGYYEPTANQPYINVIRARAFKDGAVSKDDAYGAWLIGGNATRHEGLRVVSLQTNPDNLFSDSTGIMVPGDIYTEKGFGSHTVGMPNANYFQSGRAWERPVSLEMFEPNGEEGFNQQFGVRVRGNYSRAAAKKSLTVYSRAEYGAKNLKYQLFTDEPNQKKFKRFLLRNGGNDWYEGNIRDAIAQGVFRGYLRTCSQGTEPSVLYINGEYWGIYNIRHGYAKQHFENWCGADGDNLDWIKLESNDHKIQYEVQEGDLVEFVKLRQYFRNNDFTTDAMLEEAQAKIDFDDMIDYHIVHIFYGNMDWIANNNNVGYWRERKPGAKWRFQIFDVDSVLGLTGGADKNTDGIAKACGGSDTKVPPIFKKLSDNVTFQKMFVNRFADLLNTALKPERTRAMLSDLAGKMRPEIERNVNRWTNMTSVNAWESQIAEIDDFFVDRPDIQIEHLQDHFPDATGDMHTLALAKTGEGEIQLNTIESGEGEGKFTLPFTGDYFELTPVTLTAKPGEGQVFSKWIVDGADYSSTEPSIELNLTANKSVTAVFEPGVVSNEKLYLRLHSFDGVTPTVGGDTDEWIVLTNCSNEVALDLSGVRIQFLKDGDATAKCDITLTEGMTIDAGGSIRLNQADYADSGWEKITNNKIKVTIWDADEEIAQCIPLITQKNYTKYYGNAGDEGGKGGEFYLKATGYGDTDVGFEEISEGLTKHRAPVILVR